MQNPFTTALILLAALSASVLASPSPASDLAAPGSVRVVARQFTDTVLSTQAACLQYSMIANMSVVAANSTYRAVFMEKSQTGTLANTAMLNKAILVAPNLTADVELNQQCGNLTEIAIQEAAVNFTQGKVAQFTFTAPISIVAGPIVILVVLLCLLVQVGVLTAL